MKTEISKELMCIALRNNAEIWLEKDRATDLIALLEAKKEKGFVSVDGQFINVADVVGIFNASTMADITRRKNGQWQDSSGNWHDKGEKVCRCGNVVPFGKICGFCA